MIKLKDKSNQDQECVEIGSDAELKWTCLLLNIDENDLRQNLTYKITETRDERVQTPFNLDQALDARFIKLAYILRFPRKLSTEHSLILKGNVRSGSELKFVYSKSLAHCLPRDNINDFGKVKFYTSMFIFFNIKVIF